MPCLTRWAATRVPMSAAGSAAAGRSLATNSVWLLDRTMRVRVTARAGPGRSPAARAARRARAPRRRGGLAARRSAGRSPPAAARSRRGAVMWCDQRAVDRLDRVVDHVVLVGPAGRSPARGRRRCARGAGGPPRPRAVVLGHDAAVARAERAERPVVLAQRHLVERAARLAGADRAVADLRQRRRAARRARAAACRARRSGAAPPGGRGRCSHLRARGLAVRARGLVPRQRAREALPSSAVGRHAEAARTRLPGRRAAARSAAPALAARAPPAPDSAAAPARRRRPRPARGPAGATSPAKRSDRGGSSAMQDEGADAVLQRQRGERSSSTGRVGADTFSRRRIARGSRPAAPRPRRCRVARGQVARLQVGEARQPAVGLAAGRRASAACRRRSRCRCRAPAPGRAPRRAAGGSCRRRDAPRLVHVPQRADHVDRLLERVDALPGVRRGRPWPRSRPRSAPAPRPSSTRPPLRMSRLAAARATTAGGRSGRLSTFGARRTRSVRAATKDSSVQASRKRGW